MTITAKLALLRESQIRNERNCWSIGHDLSELNRLDRELEEVKEPKHLAMRMLEVFGEAFIEEVKNGLVDTLTSYSI